MEELRKLKKLYDENELKSEEWSTFAVEEHEVEKWNKEKYKFCFLFSSVNVDYIKKCIHFFLPTIKMEIH